MEWESWKTMIELLAAAAPSSSSPLCSPSSSAKLTVADSTTHMLKDNPSSRIRIRFNRLLILFISGFMPSIYDPAEKYLSLIVPAYNEEHRLPGALDETMNYLRQRMEKDKSFSYEVVIVDDGSTDATKRVAFEFVKKYRIDNVRVLLLGRNHGKGETIRKGMLHARGELLIMLDADGATKINDLEKLENQISAVARKELKFNNGATNDSSVRISDVPVAAFGSRAHLEQKALATRKWYRNFLMKGFHLVVLFAAGPGIRDTQCGFKMFTRAAARKLFTNIRLKRWCFDVHFKIPIAELSVTWSEIPGSKVNPLSILNMLWEIVLMSYGYRTGMWKIGS